MKTRRRFTRFRARAGLVLAALGLASIATQGACGNVRDEVADAAGGNRAATGGAWSAAGRAPVAMSGASAYVPGPHGGDQQPCYPNATCDAHFTCEKDFICRGMAGASGAAGAKGALAGAPGVSSGGATAPSADGAAGSGAAGSGAAGGGGAFGVSNLPWVHCDDKHVRVLDLGAASVDMLEWPGPAPGWSSVDLLHGPNVLTSLRMNLLPDAHREGVVGVLQGGEQGVGVIFDFSLDRKAKLSCVNISAFDGISFWARTVAGSTVELEFDFITPTADPTTAWYARPRQTLELTGDWRRYTATFAAATLGHDGWDFGEVPSGSAGSGGSAGASNAQNVAGSSASEAGGSGATIAPGTIRGSSLIQALAWVYREKATGVCLDDITFYKGQPSPI